MKRFGTLFTLLIIATIIAACAPAAAGPAQTQPPAAAGSIAINGAGATFPFPLYSK